MRHRASTIEVHIDVLSVKSDRFEPMEPACARSEIAEGIVRAMTRRGAARCNCLHSIGDRIGEAVVTRLEQSGWRRGTDRHDEDRPDPGPGALPKGG